MSSAWASTLTTITFLTPHLRVFQSVSDCLPHSNSITQQLWTFLLKHQCSILSAAAVQWLSGIAVCLPQLLHNKIVWSSCMHTCMYPKLQSTTCAHAMLTIAHDYQTSLHFTLLGNKATSEVHATLAWSCTSGGLYSLPEKIVYSTSSWYIMQRLTYSIAYWVTVLIYQEPTTEAWRIMTWPRRMQRLEHQQVEKFTRETNKKQKTRSHSDPTDVSTSYLCTWWPCHHSNSAYMTSVTW